MCNLDIARRVSPRFTIRPFLRVGLLFSMICAASAANLHWQLNGVTFSDGGRAFGGFDFDASTGAYSSINITTTPGSVLPGSYYSSAAPYAGSTTSSSFNGVSTVPVFAASTYALTLGFSSALTAAGGTVSIAGLAQESICANPACSSVTPQRPITAGTATAVSTGAAKRWYVHDVVLSDGSQVFGTFMFDANTGTYSSISVTTTGGQAAPGAGYFFNIPASSSGTSVSLVSASPIVNGATTTLSMTFAAALTNSGGTVAIVTDVEGTCTAVDCSTSSTLRSTTIAGSGSTTQETGETAILPQIADGGGFVTEFIITNPTGAPLTCRLTFWQDSGASLLLSLNGANPNSSYVVLVPGHSTQFLTTAGLGSTVTGWGMAENVERLGVIAAFRLKASNVPESEATVEGIPATSGFAMAFDETAGFDTGFALANVSNFDTVFENLYFYDTTGAFIFSDSTRTLGPHQHESYLFSARYSSQLAGKRGTVRVYYGVQGTPANGTAGLTGLGLRVNPAGTFTSLPTVTID